MRHVFQMVWDVEEACSTWLFRVVGPYCVDAIHWLRDDRPEGLQALYERKTQLPWRAAYWPVLVCVAPLAVVHAVCKLLYCMRSVACLLDWSWQDRQDLQEIYDKLSDSKVVLDADAYGLLPVHISTQDSIVPALRVRRECEFCVVRLQGGVALVLERDSGICGRMFLSNNLPIEQLRPWHVYHPDGRYMDEDWREVFAVSKTQHFSYTKWTLVQKPPPSRWYATWQSALAYALFFPGSYLIYLLEHLHLSDAWYKWLVYVPVSVVACLLYPVWHVPITAACLALYVVCQLLCSGWQGCETPKDLCLPGLFWFQGLKCLLAPVLLSARWAFTLSVILACAPLWAVGWCGQKLGSGVVACVGFLRDACVRESAATRGQETEAPVAS